MSVKIHPTAIVSEDVILEDGVSIGAYAYVGDNVHMHKGVEVMHHANIVHDTEIGENTRVFPFATLGSEPQDLKFGGERTYLKIGANTVIREYCDFNTSTGEGSITTVGDGCYIMAYVHIAHNCGIGNNVIMANAVNLAGHVNIHDNAIIGGLTGLHQFTRVGSFAMVGAGCLIRKDIPPYAIVVSQPTKIKAFNIIGLRRNGFSEEEIAIVKELYRIVYHSKLNTAQALEKIEADFDSNERTVKKFVDFIRSSDRGILL